MVGMTIRIQQVSIRSKNETDLRLQRFLEINRPIHRYHHQSLENIMNTDEMSHIHAIS
jgi:hypothetical protein